MYTSIAVVHYRTCENSGQLVWSSDYMDHDHVGLMLSRPTCRLWPDDCIKIDHAYLHAFLRSHFHFMPWIFWGNLAFHDCGTSVMGDKWGSSPLHCNAVYPCVDEWWWHISIRRKCVVDLSSEPKSIINFHNLEPLWAHGRKNHVIYIFGGT